MSRPQRPLIVVANRLPVSRGPDGWHASAGGLVTAMRPVMERAGGAWVGWDDDPEGVPRRVEDFASDLFPVRLDDETVAGYYHGFANRTLWPLFHDLIAEPVIDRGWWRDYQDVNRSFVRATVDAAQELDETPLLWVHDYHLMLAPRLLRTELPDAPIGFFLHTPFPPPELFTRLPWHAELLQGILAADAVGFHTVRYRDNFVRAVQQLFPGVNALGDRLVLPDGRQVRAVAHPISIDAAEFSELGRSDTTETELAELTEQFEGRKVFLGVDRLDYTKGIRHRLQSIESLLERNPELRTQFAFVQLAVPSRDDVQEYRDLRTQVETEVGRINGRFTEPGHDVPVHYLYRGVSREKLAAYYRLADVMCVTPLKDGMNLVAKEFVIVQAATGGSGALLLSQFAGTALEFADDAVLCNPFDVEGMSLLMEATLGLGTDDRLARIRRMAESVREEDVFRWVDEELDAVERSHLLP